MDMFHPQKLGFVLFLLINSLYNHLKATGLCSLCSLSVKLRALSKQIILIKCHSTSTSLLQNNRTYWGLLTEPVINHHQGLKSLRQLSGVFNKTDVNDGEDGIWWRGVIGV